MRLPSLAAEADRQLLTRLRSESARVLAEVLPESSGSNVILLDFPSYMNVGDSMIWAGELAYLSVLGKQISYSSDIPRFSATRMAATPPDAPILLQGGGNFGDLWPQYQRFRERIVEAGHHRRIVQLPQSIHFQDARNAKRANAILAKHPNFTLLVRDSASIEIAHELLPDLDVRFCHDMALGWTPGLPSMEGGRGVLVLARNDRERAEGIPDIGTLAGPRTRVDVADWGLRGVRRAMWRAVRLPGWLVRRRPQFGNVDSISRLVERGYAAMLSLNLRAGIALFQRRDLVISDRLHAHVLAVLLDIPHIAVDNSYGKVANVMAASTGAFTTCHSARNEHEIADITQALLK